MGRCLSGDVKGGKQAIGGVQQGPIAAQPNNNNNAQNDAVEFFFRSRGLQPLLTPIELSLSPSELIDCDITSKSDPMAIMYTRKRDGKLQEVGRTEFVMNDLNPSWIEKITIAYRFEMVQPLVFHIYGVDTKYHNVPEKILDADSGHQLYSSTGGVATRDSIQFVPRRKVQSGQLAVVQALLEELPGQFFTYVRSSDVKPHTLAARSNES